jgi:hypothetical protein
LPIGVNFTSGDELVSHLRLFDRVRLGLQGVESAFVRLRLDVALERVAVDEVFPAHGSEVTVTSFK